ncbi:MAG: cytidine deaminase [Anaerolineales bacterium]
MTNPADLTLIQSANAVRRNAYAPYSHYRVGAALRAKSGRVYTGVNVENAAYPTTMCAERVALFKAISEGEREFESLALVTENGGSPCGACRQALSEFGLELRVLIADGAETLLQEISLSALLPEAFTPQKLKAEK